MSEIMVKTHLIITDTHEEYSIKWTGRIIDARPLFENGKPVFAIVSNDKRVELNTTDMKHIEKVAKRITSPRGREAITTDTARIYIKEENGHELLLGTVTHNHVRQYVPMFDKIEWR